MRSVNSDLLFYSDIHRFVLRDITLTSMTNLTGQRLEFHGLQNIMHHRCYHHPVVWLLLPQHSFLAGEPNPLKASSGELFHGTFETTQQRIEQIIHPRKLENMARKLGWVSWFGIYPLTDFPAENRDGVNFDNEDFNEDDERDFFARHW